MRHVSYRSSLVSAAFLMMATASISPSWASPYSDINRSAAAGPIRTDRLRGNLAMLSGSGGNITAFSTKQGFLLVDCGISLSRSMISQALRTISSTNIRYAINTHWHWDHADGNAWVRASGATILADRRAVERLASTVRVEEWEHTFTPIRTQARPNISINGDRNFRWQNELIQVRHYDPGHTDTDISVYFARADVLSVGDTFWNGQYPFIDHSTGGSIDGAIAAANKNIAMSKSTTIIIPGHGPVGDRVSQIAFRDMLVDVRARVQSLKRQGLRLEQVQARRPTASYDAKWGRSVISGALFTALVYRGV